MESIHGVLDGVVDANRSSLEEDDVASADEDPDAPRLPWGVRKRLLDEAPPSNGARPQSGDEVSVHYEGKLLDGTSIGSSRDAGKPFTFVIDERPRQIIQGLELAVQTMKKGEVAEFTIAPRFAYDDLGSPPLVPPDATLVFEVELLDWEAKADLFEDGRAVKTILERGAAGGKIPEKGHDVVLSLKVTSRKDNVLQEHKNVDHTVGAPDFGSISKIASECLTRMVEGERSKVVLRRFAGDTLVDSAHSGATLDLTLERVFEVADVSPEGDGSLIKKVLAQGEGSVSPRHADRVKLRIDSVTDGIVLLASSAGPRTLDFTVGDGEVCDALEFAVANMNVGEEASLTCRQPLQFCDAQLGLAEVSVQQVVFTVKLLSLDANSDPAALPLDEKIRFGGERKDVGAKLFKQQRYAMALQVYGRILDLFPPTENDSRVRLLRSTCDLNRAACLLKVGNANGAKAACDKVLETDPDQVKALYRRASAQFELSDFAAAMRDLTKVLKLEPQNGPARALAAQVKEAQRAYSQQAKSTALRMISGQQAAAVESGPASDVGSAESACLQLFKLCGAIFPCLPSQGKTV